MTVDVLTKQRKLLSKEGLDALVAVSPENVAYTVGYMIPSQVIPIRKRHFFSVVTPSDKAYLIVVNIELNEAKARSRLRDIRSYNEFTEDPAVVLADCLREFGLAEGRIGLEIDFLPARTFGKLQNQMPKANFVDAEPLLDRLRIVKTDEEIAILKRCGQIVDQVHKKVYEEVRPGMTELDIVSRIVEEALAKGVDFVNKVVVGAGERSAFPNAAPSSRVLRPGDVMRVDIFANVNGYMSDIARTTVVGTANAEQRAIWQSLVDAQDMLLGLLKPGASTAAIWRQYLAFLKKRDLDPGINFVGHGLGLTLHEEPYISRYHDTVLEEGMVLAVEPVYFTEKIGFHLEDEVIVTSDGFELISDGRGPLVELG